MSVDEVEHSIQLVQELEAASQLTKRGKASKHKCQISNSDKEVYSWKFNEWDYGKTSVKLPINARGLFTLNDDRHPRIVARGYDKFFNIEEVSFTRWDWLTANTVGPYEVTVKENGCIIFISGLEDGTLVVCSKHSTGARDDTDKNHSMAGDQFLRKQLNTNGIDPKTLGKTLYRMNATAVAEYCDDSFEEHILEYTKDAAGLYLHGINPVSYTHLDVYKRQDHIKPELTSPQAIPLSPISSPLARPIHMLRKPSFEPPPFDAEQPPPSHSMSRTQSESDGHAPKDPPSYQDVLVADGLSTRRFPPSLKITDVNGCEVDGTKPLSPRSGSVDSGTGDFAFSFSFNGTTPESADLPNSVLKAHSPKMKPLALALNTSRRGSLQSNLPSTVKNSSEAYNDISNILGRTESDANQEQQPSRYSSTTASPRTSTESARSFFPLRDDLANTEPLLHAEVNQTTDTLLPVSYTHLDVYKRQ